MTQEEFEDLKKNDSYLIPRRDPTENDVRFFLQEVDFCCPMCGKLLQSRNQRKPGKRLFDIAHIYPNSPTKKQYETLWGQRRLGETSESFENKIALCKNCHATYDYRTTKDEYLNLLEIKTELLKKTTLREIIRDLNLDEEISEIIQKLSVMAPNELTPLNYSPVQIKKKFSQDEGSELLLKTKVSGYVRDYYTYIRSLFNDLEANNSEFRFDILASEVRLGFNKIEQKEKNKAKVFEYMVSWLKDKSCSSSKEACEAVVSFFIQNCEVFNEISQ